MRTFIQWEPTRHSGVRMLGNRDLNPLLAVGAIFLLVGLPLLAVGVSFARDQYLRSHGLVRTGMIATGMVMTKSRGTTSDWTGFGYTYNYHVTYRFPASRGDVVSDEAEVDESTWEGLTERGPIRVRYLPDAPQHHVVDGQRGNWIGVIVFNGMGGLFTAIGVALIAFGLLWSRTSRHVRQPQSGRGAL